MSATTFNGMPIPQCFQDLEDVLAADVKRVILYGPPGTGKTFAGLTLGINEAGSERLTCTEDMTTADVAGMFIPNVAGGFEFVAGAALRAWQGNGTVGSRLVIDEIDKAGGDVFAQMLAFTDTEDSASFTRPDNGAVIRPLPGYSVIMTSNIEDPNELPIALKDRFPIAIEINAPHPAALMGLPENLRQIAAVVVAGKPGERASLRAFYEFHRLIQNPAFTAERAAKMVFRHMAQPIIDSVGIGTLNPSFSL